MRQKYTDEEIMACINFTLRQIFKACPSDLAQVRSGEISLITALQRSRLICLPLDVATVEDGGCHYPTIER